MTGQKKQSKTKTNIDFIKLFVYKLLINRGMTTKELTKCLMSKPYNVKSGDLESITLAIQGLIDSGLLRVGLRTNKKKFEIESVFNLIS